MDLPHLTANSAAVKCISSSWRYTRQQTAHEQSTRSQTVL